MAEEELSDLVLPDVVSFTGNISDAGGGRLVLTIPSSLCGGNGRPGLVKRGETVNVSLVFPYRRIAKAATRLESVRSKVQR